MARDAQHDLYPPPWVRALYQAFTLPFLIIAACLTLAAYSASISFRNVLLPISDYLTAAPERMAALAGVILLIFVSGALAFGTILLFGAHARASQRRRNQIFSVTGRTSDEPYVLYLRPFREDRRSRVANPFEGVALFVYGARVSLEVFFSLVLHPDRRFVAVGDKFSTLGADKLKVDDAHWFAAMQDLARRADAIVMIPGYRGATGDEIDFLFANRDLLTKTVFIQPSCYEHDHHWRDWVDYMNAAQARGVPLPAPVYEGQVFFTGFNGSTISLPLSQLDAAAGIALIERASAAALNPHGLASAAPMPSASAEQRFNFLRKLRDAPRSFVGIAMLLLALCFAFAAAAAGDSFAQRNARTAASPTWGAYYECLKRLDAAVCESERQASERLERRAAAVPFEEADALVSNGRVQDAEQLLYDALVSASPAMRRYREQRGDASRAQLVEMHLRRGLTPSFPPAGSSVAPPDAAPGSWLNAAVEEDANPYRGEGDLYPLLRELVADERLVDFIFEPLCEDETCAVWSIPAQTGMVERIDEAAGVMALLARGHESAGNTDALHAMTRRRLVLLLYRVSLAGVPAESAPALAEALEDAARVSSDDIPWPAIATMLETAQRDGRLAPEAAPILERAIEGAP